MRKSVSESLLLLLDKQGSVGKSILAGLSSNKTQTVFVTASNLSLEEELPEVFLIPYKRKIPLLPDAHYKYILVVYNGEKEVFTVLESLIKKAESEAAKFILVLPIILQENMLADFVLQLYKDTYVIYAGDVFAKNVFQKGTIIQQFFASAKNNGAITIAGMGLEKTYPVFLEDAASAILEVMFGRKDKERVFFLFPKHPITLLSLGRVFQKIDPNLHIDFVGNGKEENFRPPEKEGKYLLSPDYPLQKRIKDVYESVPEKEMPEFQTEKDDASFTFLIIYFLLSFLFLPVLLTMFFSFAGYNQLIEAKEALKKGNFVEVGGYAKRAHTLFNIASPINEIVSFETSFISLEKGQNAALALSALAKSSQAFSEGEGVGVSSGLRQAGAIMQELQLNNYDSILSTIDILPEILGFVEKRVYLVLFQNNMELRPGGGFIGSYAIVTLDKGKLLDFAIHDVYDADGQLKGHVEPPYAIRRHLPSAHWYMRDSNFNADFIKNASASSFFLRTETGINVDGVIAVDVSFVRMILSAIGPVEVLDYKETVTSQNIYTLVQKYSQEDFFPGSNQKKDFLRSLSQAIQIRLASNKAISYVALFEAVVKGIKEKHLLFAFANPATQNVFTVNKMSSSLWDAREEKEDNLHDFLGISEANLGVNKVNYFMTRNVKQSITLTKEGAILENLIIKYKNNSNDKTLGGDYKNYIRLILPLGTKLSQVIIDNVEQVMVKAVTDPILYEEKRFIKPVGLEVEQTQENAKEIFGFLLTVPQGKETTVAISYELPKKGLLDNNQLRYNLWLFKQPGIDEYPHELSFSYPDEVMAIKTSGGLSVKEGKIFVKKTIVGDEQIDISFAKK